MKHPVSQIVTRLFPGLYIGQIILLLNWMIAVRYVLDRIEPVKTVYSAVAMSIAVLLAIQTASAFLSCFLEGRSNRHDRRARALHAFLLLVVGSGASCLGWTAFSIAAALQINGRTLAFASVITAASLAALTLSVEAVLGCFSAESPE